MNQAISHILVASDFSRFSDFAVKRGFVLAQRHGANLCVVHSIPSSALFALREFLINDTKEDTHRKLLTLNTVKLNRSVKRILQGQTANVQTQLLEGDPDDRVAAFAQQNNTDLQIIGAHGKGFVRQLLLGSIASRLVRKAHCPVLVVKTPAKSDYKKALIGVDFSAGSALAVQTAQRLAPDAHLLLAHAHDVPFAGMLRYAGIKTSDIDRYRDMAREKSLTQLHALAKQAGLKNHDYTPVSVEGVGAKPLLELQSTFGADLMVVGKHGRHLTEELLLGSVTQSLLARGTSDVLVVVSDALPESAPLFRQTGR